MKLYNKNKEQLDLTSLIIGEFYILKDEFQVDPPSKFEAVVKYNGIDAYGSSENEIYHSFQVISVSLTNPIERSIRYSVAEIINRSPKDHDITLIEL